MLMTPIEPGPPRSSYAIIRLLRRWAAESVAGGARLPSLVRLGNRLGLSPEASVAIASMFQLTEACLGRPLQAECCCSSRLSDDERAVLLMLTCARLMPPHLADPSIPHGLPGALLWAIASVRRLTGEALPSITAPTTCPFAPIHERA